MFFFECGHFISTHPTTVPPSTTMPSGLQPSHGHLGLTTRPQLFTSKFSLFLKFLYFSTALDSFSIPHCRDTGIQELWHLVFSVIVLTIEFGSTVFRLLINKGEFRSRPISAFVYIFALSQSECVKRFIT